MEEAHRLKRLPPYLFTIIDNLKNEVQAQGKDVIDLGMGNPDLPPPKHVVDALCEAAHNPKMHNYSKSYDDVEKRFRKAVAHWYEKKFNVVLDPDTEVVTLLGTKEGIAHLCMGLLNHDDISIVPSPAYPVHFNGVVMAGGILYSIPLLEENKYLPELHKIERSILQRSKLMFLSYPNNPLTATADKHFFDDVVKWGKGKEIVIAHDLAYSDFVYEKGYRAPSILEVKGAKDYCIEFHTLSKSYSMAGWRIGFAVGNKKILDVLRKTKSYCDFGMFKAVQEGAIAALEGPQDYVKNVIKTYRKRTEVFVNGLSEVGWKIPMPKSTFYVWAHLPLKFAGQSALDFTSTMVHEAGVAVAPGTGFGEYGEGFVRFAMVEEESRLKEAVRRLGEFINMPD